MTDSETATPGFRRAADVQSTLAYKGALMSFLINESETGGGLSVIRIKAQPGCEPQPHVHEWEHEMFYILEGEVDFFVEGVDHALRTKVGEIVFMPRGKAHAIIARAPVVEAVTILYALDGRRVGSEELFRQTADGPAQSMELPKLPGDPAMLNANAIKAATTLAKQDGIILLSEDEVAERLPVYVAAKKAG